MGQEITDGNDTGADGALPSPLHANIDAPSEEVPDATAPQPEPDEKPIPAAPRQRVSVRLQKLLEDVLDQLEGQDATPKLLRDADLLARAMTAVCILAEKEHQVDDAAPRPIDDARRAALADRIERLCKQWRTPQAPPEAHGG